MSVTAVNAAAASKQVAVRLRHHSAKRIYCCNAESQAYVVLLQYCIAVIPGLRTISISVLLQRQRNPCMLDAR